MQLNDTLRYRTGDFTSRLISADGFRDAYRNDVEYYLGNGYCIDAPDGSPGQVIAVADTELIFITAIYRP